MSARDGVARIRDARAYGDSNLGGGRLRHIGMRADSSAALHSIASRGPLPAAIPGVRRHLVGEGVG